MRVPNISTYYNATYRLGNLTESLQNANEVVSTQKQINEISDDPLGLSQALTLSNTIGNLEQIERNVTMGKSWLESGETTMDSVNKLILEAKSEVSRLSNDSTTADERRSAVERIENTIEQLVTLGNTQVNGNYIFGGTITNVPPFEHDTNSQPNRVLYKGNLDPFQIRTDKAAGVDVGRVGQETFWDTSIDINATNNAIVFKEDNGHGSAFRKVLEVKIPEGEYTKEQLAVATRNALNDASLKDGYGVQYEVEWDEEKLGYSIRQDGTYDGFMRTEFMWNTGEDPVLNDIKTSALIDSKDVNISLLHKENLTLGTPTPTGTDPFTLTWDGVSGWNVDGNPGYILPAKITGTADSVDIDLDENGITDISIRLDNEVKQQGESISFEMIPYRGDNSIGHEMGFDLDDLAFSPATSDNRPEFITNLNITSGANTIDFIEYNSTGGVSNTLHANITPNNYFDMDVLALEIENRLEDASNNPTAGGNTTNYAVSYDAENSRFNIREDGSTLNQIEFKWSNTSTGADTTAATLGFYPLDDIISYPSSDTVPMHGSISIDNTNNRIDFVETNTAGVSTTLVAVVASGAYKDITALQTAIETAMNTASLSGNTVTYDVTYDNTVPPEKFTIQRTSGTNLTKFDLLWANGTNWDKNIGTALGYDVSTDDLGALNYDSDAPPVLLTFTSANNKIDFRETRVDGTVSDEISIEIPSGDYTSLDAVAAQIETELDNASPNFVDYSVLYDFTAGKFLIKGSSEEIKGFDLLWKSGANASESAAGLLGVDIEDDITGYSESDEELINLVIDNTNNKIDFQEVPSENVGQMVSNLTASVRAKTYTSYTELGNEIEIAMEAESHTNGNKIDYSVTYDSHTERFTIKEKGTSLDEFRLQWKSGENASTSVGGNGQGIGDLLGFEPVDDIKAPVKSEKEVEWGIFNTLIDLKGYLTDNDVDGIERSIGRLESNYDTMTSRIVDSGMKYSRLLVRESITSEISLSMTKRKSSIEDADIVESIMDLKGIETAYQAALSSTSKVLNLSLVDYLR